MNYDLILNIKDDNLGTFIRQYYLFQESREIYIGQWKDGHMNGYGRLFYPNGNIYEGDFNMNTQEVIKSYEFIYFFFFSVKTIMRK